MFGSTVHGHWFSTTSDIDIAASGLASDDYFTAVARLQDLSPEFKVDLVALEHCKAELRESIAARESSYEWHLSHDRGTDSR